MNPPVPSSRSRTSLISALGLVLALGLAIALALLAGSATRAPASHPTTTSRDERHAFTITWGRPELASLHLLRRVIIDEARRTQLGLAPCEHPPHARTEAARRAAYRACAFATLARTGESGRISGTLLMNLANDSAPTPRCRARIGGLAGASFVLGQLAQATLGEQATTTWADLRAASRAIRGLSSEVRRLARAHAWSLACRSAPGAPGGERA